MLTIILIGVGIILVAVLIVGYSSKSPKVPTAPRGAAPTDVSADQDRRRATGQGDN